MHQTTTDSGLRIGELAERAGLTVRTLHHYDLVFLSNSGPEKASRGDLLEYVTRAQT